MLEAIGGHSRQRITHAARLITHPPAPAPSTPTELFLLGEKDLAAAYGLGLGREDDALVEDFDWWRNLGGLVGFGRRV